MNRIVFVLMLCAAGHAHAADYYVATNGSDGAAGTMEAPFATIQRAADVMGAGDTCFIRGGNYHEEVVIDNLDGTSANPILFTAYSNEVVVLDGSQDVSELGSSGWMVHSGNIYKTTLTSDISQVFVDGEWMMLARWPNARFDDESAWSWDTWAQGDEALSTPGHEYDAAANGHDLAATGLDMTDAMAVLNVGNFATRARVVTNHAAGVDNFMYGDSDGTYKTVNHYYFFDSKLNLLDNETEWHFDPLSKTLYLWAPGGGVPSNVRGKNQDNAFFFTDSQHIQVKGLDFFAATFRMDTCDNMTVEDCDLQYPCFNKRTLGQTGEIMGTRIENSTYVKVLNCSFGYTDGLVMKLTGGDHNTVENCTLHHLDYTVAHHSGNSGFIWWRNSPFGVFRRNTVYKTGASEGVMTSDDMLVELNDISDVAHLQSDGAVVHLFQGHTDVDVNQNWFHNCRKPSLRMSDGPKDYLPDGLMRTGVARRNVIFDMPFNGIAMQFKGDERECYNNLCENIIRFSDDSADPATSGIHANSVSRNNAVETWITLAPSAYEAPSGSHSNNWEGGLLGSNIVDQVRDWSNRDFRPRAGSQLVDAGTAVSGVTDGYLGAAPDIGAYEYGETSYWIPGRKLVHATTPVPPNLATNVKADVDLMWLEGYHAISHDIYFGTSPGNLVYQGNQSNNIFTPESLATNTTYYWRIDAVTAGGTVTGEVWSFTSEYEIPVVLDPLVLVESSAAPSVNIIATNLHPNGVWNNITVASNDGVSNETMYGQTFIHTNDFLLQAVSFYTGDTKSYGAGQTLELAILADTDSNSVPDTVVGSVYSVPFESITGSKPWKTLSITTPLALLGNTSYGFVYTLPGPISNNLRASTDNTKGYDGGQAITTSYTAGLFPEPLPPSLNTGRDLVFAVQGTSDPADYYAAWAGGYALGSQSGYADDPDGDALINLAEYALGGVPDNLKDAPHPTFENLEYVYRRRTDAAARGLTYALEECSNLVSNDWNAVTYPPAGIMQLEPGFEAVTNQIPVTEDNQFIRLRISID